MTGEYFDYYGRNIGFFTLEEQEILKNSTISILGEGGVGGGQHVALARMGICNYSEADPKTFDAPDSNRQYGAKYSTMGLNKARVMEKEIRDINPFSKIKVFDAEDFSIDELLEGADIAIDAVDYFAFDKKMEFFKKAREKNIYTLSCPIPGASAVLLVFSPNGMTAEEYFRAPKNEDEWKNYTIPIDRLTPERIDYIPNDIFSAILRRERSFPTISSTAFISAGLLSFETAMILTKKREPIVVPDVQVINLYVPVVINCWSNF